MGKAGVGRLGGGGGEARFLEFAAGAHQAGNGQAVPRRQTLVVGDGLFAQVARGLECSRPGIALGGLGRRHGLGQKQHIGRGCIRVVRVLEIRAKIQAKQAAGGVGIGRIQRGAHFRTGPEVIQTFLPVHLRILGGPKHAAGVGHFAQQVIAGLAQHEPAQWRNFAVGLGFEEVGVELEQLAVVVEHLFKVGHQPALVHAVAVEAAADLIKDAAAAHLIQRAAHLGHEFRRRHARRFGFAQCLVQQELRPDRLRKFRRIAKAAMGFVVQTAKQSHRARRAGMGGLRRPWGGRIKARG